MKQITLASDSTPFEQKISELLSCPKKIWERVDHVNDQAKWTKAIKEMLVDSVKAVNKDANLRVAACGIDKRDCGEWLYDFVCYENHHVNTKESENKNGLKRIFLVAECEWKKADYKYQLQFDFEKLLVARAEHRLMIFEGRDTDEVTGYIEYFKTLIKDFSQTQPGDRYIFAGWIAKDNTGFHIDHYVHPKQ